jgi:LysM repeat protein
MRPLLRPVALAALLLVGHAESTHAQSLLGSRESVLRMAQQASAHGLRHYDNAAAVQAAVRRGDLARLTGNRYYAVADVSYPFAVPEVVTFVERLATQHHAACGERLVVTSAVRPRTMRLINGSDLSVHPAGMAIDLRKPQNTRCLSWLRETLISLEGAGVIEATEEFRPPHFHVAVYPRPYERYVQARGGEIRLARGESIEPQQTSRSALRPASEDRGTTHVVRPGETLSKIAVGHGVGVRQLKEANQLRSDQIRAGQTLRVPSAGTPRAAPAASRARTYQVRPGDSLWSIAKRHGTSVEALRRANRLNGDVLRAGQRLTLPG